MPINTYNKVVQNYLRHKYPDLANNEQIKRKIKAQYFDEIRLHINQKFGDKSTKRPDLIKIIDEVVHFHLLETSTKQEPHQ